MEGGPSNEEFCCVGSIPTFPQVVVVLGILSRNWFFMIVYDTEELASLLRAGQHPSYIRGLRTGTG